MVTADRDVVKVGPQAKGPKPDDETIVQQLEGYRLEAELARNGGDNPRDDKWRENLDLYWNRYDFSEKADWQAQETMPEVPAFVDRFSASLKEALIAVPDSFYQIIDPADQEKDITEVIKSMTDVWLSTAGRNQVGTPQHFSTVFEEQMKLGAMKACSSVVTWKEDVPGGRVAVESVDPQFIWLDHTFRDLYRIRRTEIDLHDLKGMAKMKDSKGKPIFKLPEFDSLMQGSTQINDEADRDRQTGHGTGLGSSQRVTVTLDEYIATVLDSSGEVIADKGMFVVANQQHLIRGPEKNPFWHGKDWLTYAPLVTVPLSVYGRSYMEDFGSVATTFTHLTNMILDAVHMSAMKAYALVPGMLLNPEQAVEGVHPNKTFLLEDGFRAEDFMKALDLGTLPAEVVSVWQSMKTELREAAGVNEIGMGQFAPNSRTSATEVASTQQSSSAIIRSIAQTVETRYLEPTLDLVWKTGLQHVAKDNPTVLRAGGNPELVKALLAKRKELIKRPISFQARGISTLIQKGQMLKSILQILSIVGSNPLLTQEFLRQADMGKLINLLFELSNVPLSKLQLSEREKQIRSLAEPIQQAEQQGGGGGAPTGGRLPEEMGSLAKSMGVARETSGV